MNRNAGMFLVFIALILLSVLVLNGLYFNTPAAEVEAPGSEEKEVETDYITTNLNISQEIEYDPEVADVVLGFENESEEQAEAVRENNEIVSSLMAVLEEEGLEEVETQYYRVYPYSRYNEEDEKITYYRVTNQIKFTTEDLADLPVLLAKLLDAGANRVVDLNYRLKSNQDALDEVSAMALSSLKDKAAFMAENLDKENYRIKEVNFGSQNIYGAEPLAAMSRKAEAAGISEVPLSEEKVNIRVSISAEVELY